MKRTGLLLMGLIITIIANGQIVKVQGGTSFSKLDWKMKDFDWRLFDETLIGYSIFAGIDYFDKQYFNLSSNIGMLRKGGRKEIEFTDPFGNPLGTSINKKTLDYLSINTMIDLKYRIKETISPFISFGPRFDYLLKNGGEHFYGIEELDNLNSVSVGLILGGGIKYDISNLQFGLRADYYLDFTKVADWSAENARIGGGSVNTFTINLSIGYKLK